MFWSTGGPPAHAGCPHLFVRNMARMVTPRGADSVQMPLTASHESASDSRWSRLMAAAQAGDRAAYERLLRDIPPFIRAIVRRQHGTRDRVAYAGQDLLPTPQR